MTRLLVFLLSLCLLCPLILIPVAAETAVTVTLRVGEDSTVLTEDVLPVPNDPEGEGRVFAGWAANGIFLPAGAAYTGETDVELTAIFVGISTVPDSAIRTESGKNGIRFLTHIDKADLALLKEHTEVYYGTYFAPKDYVTAAHGVLTPEKLLQAEKTYLEVETDKFYQETETVATVAGSLVDILSKNRYRQFQAAGYIQVTYTNETSGAVIAPASTAVRLYDLSMAAFSDRTVNANATHTNATTHGYSPYGADHLNYFAWVMDAVVSLKYFTINESAYTVTPNYFGYQPPYVAGYVLERAQIEFVVKEGQSYRFDRDLSAVITRKPNGQYAEAANPIVTNSGKTLRIDYLMGDFTPNH